MRVVIYNETNTRSGPSDRDRTCGLMVPNHPRSQLRHTRISIQFFFFAWKWDKLWSNANSTPFCVFIKCRKSALLKGFRDFCKITAIPAGHAPKYKIEYFLGNFRHFVALSSGKQILFEPLVSTVSICSKNDCGMRCGRKNTPRTRNLLGEFAVGGMLTLNRQKVKSFLPSKIEPQ